MKIRLEEGMKLVITPENYVEMVALNKWMDTHPDMKGGILFEGYPTYKEHLDPITRDWSGYTEDEVWDYLKDYMKKPSPE